MKVIRIIFIGLLAFILVACTGIFIFLQIYDTDQYLPQITKKISTVLGRPVSVGHLGLGLSSRGITLDAGPVTISDDADFTDQPFIKIDRVSVSFDLGSLVLQREIHITNILLQSPQVHFIVSEEGNINIHSIGQVDRSSGDEIADKGPVIASPSSTVIAKSAQGGEAISERTINSITIQDASISFIDQNETMPLDIWLTNINASLNDLSLSKRSVRASDIRLKMDLSQLDVKNISPEIPESTILKDIKGIVELTLAHMQIGPSGDLVANGDIAVKGGVIKNFNIIKVILAHTLSVLGNIDNILSGQLNVKLGSDDTILEKAEAKFSVHDKTVFIDDSLIATNIFELTAKGSVDRGLNTTMQTTLHLNTDVSASLINELEGVKYLMDDSKRVTIGASLEGVIPHLKYKPNKDFRKKGKKAINAMFRQLFGA